ncbi:Ig-like domain-containing protein [Patescibacteria group bacterium]|nr:Ig-like domain-containing protein [Patescibacteria group bacterium]
MMRSPYSRLQQRYTKQTQQRLILSLIGSIILVVILVIYGLPALFNLTGTISSFRRGNSATVSSDNTVAPTTPELSQDLTATSSAHTKVHGVADPNITVEIFQNGRSLGTVVASNDGTFTQDADLEKGPNSFTAQAVNDANQKSDVSEAYVVSFLSGQPKLDLSSPKDGDSFNNQTISVSGATDPGDTVSINDRLAIVDKDGNFSYSLNLNSGDNKLKITATDPAGNTTSKELTVKYQQ